MDTVRYVIGVLLVMGIPPAIAMWLLVHPLAQFWRRLGPGVTYILVGTLFVATWVLIFQTRDAWLGRDLGTEWILVVLGLVPYGVSTWLTMLTKRHLTFKMLAGVPEVSASQGDGRLLEEGVYGFVRHPRYVSIVLGVLGLAMVANYVGAYVLAILTIPALLVVIALEERELAQRFGPAYANYRARVPMLIPRRPPRS